MLLLLLELFLLRAVASWKGMRGRGVDEADEGQQGNDYEYSRVLSLNAIV